MINFLSFVLFRIAAIFGAPTIWEDATGMIEDIFDVGLALLQKLADAIQTNVFVLVLFAMFVAGVASWVVSLAIKVLNKIRSASTSGK